MRLRSLKARPGADIYPEGDGPRLLLCPSLTISHLLFLCWHQRSPSKQFDFSPCEQRPGPARLCLGHVAVHVCARDGTGQAAGRARAVLPGPLAWHRAGVAASSHGPGGPEGTRGAAVQALLPGVWQWGSPTTGTHHPSVALAMKHRPGAAWKRHGRTHGPT